MDVDSDLLVALAHGPLGERPLVHRGDRSWTGAEIAEATDEVAARLRRAGVAPGTAVGVVVPATPTGVVMLLAVWRAGAVCAPVDADRSGPDLERVLADVRPAVVVQPSNDAGSLVPVVAARTGEPRAFSTDVALVLTSPDASGPAAPVRIDHSDLLAAVAAACDRIPGRHADDHRVPAPDLVPLPLASWDGVLGILTAVRTGAAVILLDPESPEGVVGAVRSSGLTTAVLAAPTVARLLDDPGIGSLPAQPAGKLTSRR